MEEASHFENDQFPLYSGPLFLCDFCQTFFISYTFLEKHQKKCENLKIMTFLKMKLTMGTKKKGNLLKIMQEKLREKLFHSHSCEICYTNFCNSNDYEQHMKLHEEQNQIHDISYIAHHDLYETTQEKARDLLQENISCVLCDLCFDNFTDYREHMAMHKNEKNGNIFSQKPNYYSYMKIIQNNEMKFDCSYCSEVFDEKSLLIKHLRIHSEMRPFICLKCERNFKSLDDLYCHVMKVHNKKLKVKCNECEKSFFTKRELITHGILIHKHETPFKCDICLKMFCTRSGLISHKIMHTGEKPFQCPECQKSFSKKGSLLQHINGVHKKEKLFKCEICFKELSSKSSLMIHQRTHTGERPYICPQCGESYTQKGELDKHILREHKMDKPFQCDICQKLFLLKKALAHHMITHSEEKPFKCQECEKSFKTRCSLNKHDRCVHKKERPLICHICSKGFSQRSNLDTHIKTVHKKERNFLCDICSKTFGQKSSLTLHKKLHCIS